MKKKNRGFTLIELIVAIAVLSIMALVLLQTFVVSRRMDLRARQDEVVQDAAKKTMEAMKGYSFGELERWYKEGHKDEPVTIAGTEYQYELLLDDNNEEAGYRLTCPYSPYETDSKAFPYLITAEAYFSTYSAETDSVYSINNYRMPEIADVSNIRNVVMEPELFTKDDEFRREELLLKVNPEPETDEAGNTVEPEEIFEAGDVSRYLQIAIKEDIKKGGTEGGDGKMEVTVKAAYTVDQGGADSINGFEPDQTIISTVLSEKKRIVWDETEKVLNRIYLFLPKDEDMKFEKIFVQSDTKNEYELYIIVPEGRKYEEAAFPQTIKGKLNVHTNQDGDFVSVQEAKKRLYQLTVTVYEADYSGADVNPKKGKELLTLHSSKRE